MNALISLADIWLRRGERELFQGLRLDVAAADLIWLRAPNGSGKTSLLRIMAGLLEPDRGERLWKSQAFSLRFESERAPIGLLDEKLGLARDLDVAQNLSYTAALAGQPSHVLQQTFDSLNLGSLLDRPVGQLSTGQKKRVGLARMRLEGAELWLLDEPANGLDAENRSLLCRQVEEHVATGGACVFASHDALPFETPIKAVDLEALCAA